MKIKTALISVFDKTGIVGFAKSLVDQNIKIISSGGTYATLVKNGIEALEVEDITKMPEIMDGRVKTLHPKIHGGILARRGIDDEAIKKHEIPLIDLVVVNLYPFVEVVSQENCTLDNAIKNIDIGGPAMIRAAAKNHEFVSVVTNACDYDEVLDSLKANNGIVAKELRCKLAAKAFSYTAEYDYFIQDFLSSQYDVKNVEKGSLTILGQDRKKLRYGENHHQEAFLYKLPNSTTNNVANAKQIWGKELSFNNYMDADTAYECVKNLQNYACVIVKHSNPCGCAYSKTNIVEAYNRAYNADSESAFGGVIAINKPLDVELLQEIINQQFVEVIIAPDLAATQKEIEEAVSKKPNLRILIADSSALSTKEVQDIKSLNGGFLVQTDKQDHKKVTMELQTKNESDEDIKQQLLFAWEIVRHVKSNAIVIVKDNATIGIGCGQTSRVRSVKLAVENAKQMKLELKGSVLASDAFFPFRDSIDKISEFGISAIVQPGGSMRDGEVIEGADENNIAMYFTKTRVFRH